jgi:hypothetical protein
MSEPSAEPSASALSLFLRWWQPVTGSLTFLISLYLLKNTLLERRSKARAHHPITELHAVQRDEDGMVDWRIVIRNRADCTLILKSVRELNHPGSELAFPSQRRLAEDGTISMERAFRSVLRPEIGVEPDGRADFYFVSHVPGGGMPEPDFSFEIWILLKNSKQERLLRKLNHKAPARATSESD